MQAGGPLQPRTMVRWLWFRPGVILIPFPIQEEGAVMATQRQIETNREDASKSTGPKTEEGKAASSANALRHGLTAELLVLLPDEDGDAFERLREGVIADLTPVSALQEVLAERAAVLLWRLDRVARMEAELFFHGEIVFDHAALNREERKVFIPRLSDDQLGEEAKAVRDEFRKQRDHLDDYMNAAAPCARVLVERRESARAFDQIARHEAMLQRSLNRTLDEFRRLRDAAGAAVEPDAPQPDESADREAEPAEPAAGADPDPAPASDARPAAPEGSCKTASESRAGTGRDAEKDILQNEANSAQRLEGTPNSASGVSPPTAPPVA